MNKLLKNSISRVFSFSGRYPTIATDIDSLLSLIKSLHPVIPSCGLIRLGGNGDGGYIVPDDLQGVTTCFSPGVGSCSQFELDCANLGMKVFMADGSIDSPPISNSNFNFQKTYISPLNDRNSVSLEHWVITQLQDRGGELILQMDIEGSEYTVLASTPVELLKKFRVICVEFHELQSLHSAPFFRLARNAFLTLLHSHTCVHIHPNSVCGQTTFQGITIPNVAEFTFLRTDRVGSCVPATVFPHPLDCENSLKETLKLPAVWHSSRE